MSISPERPALPLIVVHGEAAASARRRVSELLDAAGTRPGEVQHLLAVIEAGALEGAHAEVVESDTGAPAGSSDEFGEVWLGAVQAVASRFTHIADRTVRQARAAAASEPPPAVSRTPSRRSSTAVDAVGEEQVHRVLEAAERLFVSVTGSTGYDRDLSEGETSYASRLLHLLTPDMLVLWDKGFDANAFLAADSTGGSCRPAPRSCSEEATRRRRTK